MTDKVDRIAAQLSPDLAKALREALQDMRDGVNYPLLLRSIDNNDIEGVIAALNIEEGSFLPYIAAATVIFIMTGKAAGEVYRVRFDATQDVEFRQDLHAKVAAIVREQRENARVVVAEGLAAGKSRREIARELSGKLVNGHRQGGVVGLSGPQQSWVENMRSRLLSGDPAEMRATLKNKDRNKIYDRTIKKAIREGNALSPEKVDEIVGKYADKLLAKRAKDIADLEAEQFAAGAREEAVRQRLAKEGGTATKTWRHSRIYINARPDHVGMSGTTVPFDANFMMFDGTPMRYAHDPRGGAKHNANCRCRTIYSVKKDG